MQSKKIWKCLLIQLLYVEIYRILTKLRRYGTAGILSYGLLNTAYYLSAFLVTWFYIAPAPGKMGYFTAVKRFVKLMAMVWAGSQVTKLLRAGGALALAPVVAKGLSWFMAKFKFKSQAKTQEMHELHIHHTPTVYRPLKLKWWTNQLSSYFI
ncbi:uncharacterized protein [Rutidosis leptorrhynchoides]|uniref:uncharacterized protein isoform X1 n=1 Tax=Rutidosis leptorrhynchoides TaxID=125765 RepID=UPI003A9966FE